jgi:FkbM family methyltransferase
VFATNGQNMVSRRLAPLLDKADLSNVTRILDIGSWHLGQSVEFANIFPGANIEAFEPVPGSYKLCLDRHKSLDAPTKSRIRVHNLALADKDGIVPFFAVEPGANNKIDPGFSSMFKFSDGLKNSYYGDDKLLQKEIKVKASTLDSWCKKNKVAAVDIMWIDVQGAELLVFKGAKNILKNTKIIMTEVGLKPYYKGHTLKADIDKYLTTLGYKELDSAFELNGFDFEANTIYIKN